jgi:PEP-CTERM motif
VAFYSAEGVRPFSRSGIFTGSGGPVTAVAAGGLLESGPFLDFGLLPSINNMGTVAFLAFLRPEGSGIFTGPDAVADRVIGTGDPLFGSTVTSLEFARQGLNDAGQVAFVAQLADGRQVVVRADPAQVGAVPEPSALALLALGTLALAGYRWKRRRA